MFEISGKGITWQSRSLIAVVLQIVRGRDFHGRIHFQNLSDHSFSIIPRSPDIHKAHTCVVQEEGPEPALLALLVGRRFNLRYLERVFLLTAIGDGVRFFVDGHRQEQVPAIEHSSIHKQEVRNVECQQDSLAGECPASVEDQANESNHPGSDRRLFIEFWVTGIGIYGFHIKRWA